MSLDLDRTNYKDFKIVMTSQNGRAVHFCRCFAASNLCLSALVTVPRSLFITQRVHVLQHVEHVQRK